MLAHHAPGTVILDSSNTPRSIYWLQSQDSPLQSGTLYLPAGKAWEAYTLQYTFQLQERLNAIAEADHLKGWHGLHVKQ